MPQAPVLIRHGHVLPHVNDLSLVPMIMTQIASQSAAPDVSLLAEVVREVMNVASAMRPGHT